MGVLCSRRYSLNIVREKSTPPVALGNSSPALNATPSPVVRGPLGNWPVIRGSLGGMHATIKRGMDSAVWRCRSARRTTVLCHPPTDGVRQRTETSSGRVAAPVRTRATTRPEDRRVDGSATRGSGARHGCMPAVRGRGGSQRHTAKTWTSCFAWVCRRAVQ